MHVAPDSKLERSVVCTPRPKRLVPYPSLVDRTFRFPTTGTLALTAMILAERRHRGKMWREHPPDMASLLPPQVPIPCLYAKLLDWMPISMNPTYTDAQLAPTTLRSRPPNQVTANALVVPTLVVSSDHLRASHSWPRISTIA